jgi:hypothetical protein
MIGKILPFGLTRPAAQQRIRTFMAEGKYDFDPHLFEQMILRDISMKQVLVTAEEGTINQGPTLDEYNEWRCRLKKRVAGRLVRVVVAIQAGGLLLITTF